MDAPYGDRLMAALLQRVQQIRDAKAVVDCARCAHDRALRWLGYEIWKGAPDHTHSFDVVDETYRKLRRAKRKFRKARESEEADKA